MPDSPPAENGRGHPVARPALLMLWTLVFWGTLVAGAIVWRSVEIGPAAAIRLLAEGTASVPPALGRFSLVCAVVAVAVWTALAVLLLLRRSAPEREGPWR